MTPEIQPTIKIDKYAIRFEYEGGQQNFFFANLFQTDGSTGLWHRELMKAIQHCYEECVRQNIEPPSEEKNG